MSESPQAVAKMLVHILPQILGKIGSHLRTCGEGAMPAHMRSLGMIAVRPHSLTELAEMQEVSLATVSNSVSTLVERGWVERIPSDQDRRVVMVKITDSGLALLGSLHTKMADRISGWLERLSDEELCQLRDGLMVLQRIFGPSMRSTPSCLMDSPDEVAEYHEEKQ